ncbi:flagellar basal body rod modification protein [Campylobacter concisus]|uniref:flagellar basal body rod modification protein n=1 Tax=Campylobacter concisus TaxID=199 RepID=UPI000CD8448A|nr:flagellar basal body rod modification protein [Campylobacter concisus]QPH87222.1 flagellar basal body rod modification protein [Campylobacter concisus]QPI02160.1 flagellar basal body rod modification protein [Campylobacter concisus]
MASVSDITTQTTQQKNAEKKAKAKQDAAADTGTNPNAQLDKDAFMKLLLTELQYQDPTSPMDTEKMLTQTSQLASLEMQQNTNSAMKELVNQLKSNANAYAISALGKMVSTGSNSVLLTDEQKNVNFALYFKSDLANGKLEIKNANGEVVRSIDIKDLKSGVRRISWDGKDDSGKQLPNGAYTVSVNYTGKDGNSYKTQVGSYPVEAVKFVDGKAMIKIAGEYVPMDKISEFYEG